MVKTGRDVLEYLGIDHAFLTGPRNVFCTLLEISAKEPWVIAIDRLWEEPEAVLTIKYRGTYRERPVRIEKRDAFTYRLSFAGGSGGNPLEALWASIQKLEEDESLWNKRKEERHPVGAAFSPLLGLKKTEQKVILSGKEYPCLINDLSFRGMRLTTLDGGNLKKGQEAAVLLDFINPIERIILKGTVQSLVLKSGEQPSGGSRRPVRFAILSLQLPDPPLAFKQRLGTFIAQGGGR
jgi:hypothetical protein